MLAAIRTFAKSWVARILLGLLVISFAVWGVNDAFKTKLANDVIKAGKREIGSVEFKGFFDSQLKAISQENGGQFIPAAEAVKGGMLDQLLSQVAQGEALAELIRIVGVIPSDHLIRDRIRENQGFFDPVTGKFDQVTYQNLLRENNLTPETYERALSDQIADQHFSSGVGVGLRPPAIYTATLSTFGFESRGAGYFTIPLASVGQPPAPTEAQLRVFLQEYAARLRRPEVRTISLIRFSSAAAAAAAPIDEAQVVAKFEAAKGSLTTPELRSFVQIPVRDPAAAQAVATRLTRNETPAAVARSIGVEPITYTDAEAGSLPDPLVARAVFSMKAGQVSGPVRGQFGVAIVKVTKIIPGKPATLADARPGIVAQLRAQAAQEQVFDQVQKYDEAHASGASLPDAAKAVGAKVYVLGPLTKEGRDTSGRQVVGLNAQMLGDAFARPQGSETDVVDIGKGEYYALRVDKVTPSAVPPLEEVRAGLTRAWTMREIGRRLEERAKVLAERVRKGEALQAVAASAGVSVQRVDNVTRATAQQQQALGEDFIGGLFEARSGAVFTARMPNGFAVAKAEAPKAPPAQMIAMIASAQRPQLQTQMFREMGELVRTAANDRIKPVVSREKALNAINVTPEDAGDTPVKAEK